MSYRRPTAEDLERLEVLFNYHAPKGDKPQRHEAVRNAMKDAAKTVLETAPPGPEQSTAIRKLQEAMMWANASIAREDAKF
jgi:hypothetical protein